MSKIVKIQTKRTPWAANYADLHTLGSLLATQPYQMEGIVTRVYASLNYNDNPFSLGFLSGARTREITSNEWEWKLRGATMVPDTLIETNNEEIVSGRRFKLKFSKDMWLYGDEISPGDPNHKYQCRIVENPYKEGTGFVYEVELSSADTIPSQYLEAGAQWNKLFSAYGEAAVQGGSTQYSGTFAMRNKLGKLRKQYRITDYAWEEVLAIKLTDSDGKEWNTFDDYAMVEYYKQWQREIETALIYSRTTDFELDSTGHKVDKFPGLMQQLEDGIYWPTSNITLRKIEDFIDYITYNKFSPEEMHTVEFWTGRKGLEMFSRLVEGGMGTNGWVLANDSFNPVKPTSSPYHPNSYSYGYRFSEYITPSGVRVRPRHLPLLDDTTHQFDTYQGFPLSSYQMLFLDVSAVNNVSSNVQMITKKDGFKQWFVDGGISHLGPQRGGSAAHGGEWYEMHISKEIGLHIEDITRCGKIELI